MSPTNQRIAIAKACGWRGMDFGTNNVIDPNGYKHFFNSCLKSWEDIVPDYLEDLNAIHEAEKKLSQDEWEFFEFWIHHLTTQNEAGHAWSSRDLHATAKQRAESFLYARRLWVNE